MNTSVRILVVALSSCLAAATAQAQLTRASETEQSALPAGEGILDTLVAATLREGLPERPSVRPAPSHSEIAARLQRGYDVAFSPPSRRMGLVSEKEILDARSAPTLALNIPAEITAPTLQFRND
jgi:hypothetical protein